MSSVFSVEQHEDHIYEVQEKTLACRCTPVTVCKHCIKLNPKVIDLVGKEKELKKLKSELEGSKIQKKEQSNSVLSYSQVKVMIKC